MLYAVDRGNLAVMTLPPFILAFGGLVKSRWGRAIAAGLALNFKPYLALAAFAWLQRSRWKMLARVAICVLGVYLTTWAAYGAGGPLEVAVDLAGAARIPHTAGPDLMGFSSTYESVLAVSRAGGAVSEFLGPAGVTALRVFTPLAIAAGLVGGWICVLMSWDQPGVIGEARVAAHILAVFLSIGCPGGYSLLFLLFLVFLEPWRGAGRIVALVAAYLWCVSSDLPLAVIGRETVAGFLAQRPVTRELTITLGQWVRPGLLFAMEFGLVAASLSDFKAAARAVTRAPAAVGVKTTPPAPTRATV
jgi:hypothetical protein